MIKKASEEAKKIAAKLKGSGLGGRERDSAILQYYHESSDQRISAVWFVSFPHFLYFRCIEIIIQNVIYYIPAIMSPIYSSMDKSFSFMLIISRFSMPSASSYIPKTFGRLLKLNKLKFKSLEFDDNSNYF